MADEFTFDMVESPCVGNCCLDTEDICLGCYRHLDEITSWLTVDAKTREQYRQNMAQRKADKEKWLADLAHKSEDQASDSSE